MRFATKDNIVNRLIRTLLSTIYRSISVTSHYGKLLSLRDIFSYFDWKNVILLDACRYDVFKLVVEKIGVFAKCDIKPVISNASSTPEFVREVILSNKDLFRNVVYVSANPMIDLSLKSLGINPENLFYRYIPAWKISWNYNYNTVLPESLLRLALKVFIRYPLNRLVVHFIQPHFPYVSSRFKQINELVQSDLRLMLSKAYSCCSQDQERKFQDSCNIMLITRLIKLVILCGSLSSVLSIKFCRYAKSHGNDILKAYISNILAVLPSIRKLLEILPGRTLITSDHGEALGEYLHPLIPLRLWGHLSGIRIPSLALVPLISTNNDISVRQGLQRAMKELLSSSLRSLGHYNT